MDPDDKLELIALLATDHSWKAIKKIGMALLTTYYPDELFTGCSGDPGPTYVVALREALEEVERVEDA